jgi:hypothetical protein
MLIEDSGTEANERMNAMNKQFNYFVLACLLVLSASLTGCVKFKQTVTLMPDGSGKIDVSVALSDRMVLAAEAKGEDPFEPMRPTELKDSAKGIVAYTKPETRKKDGYTYMTFSVYFEDINTVELGTFEEDRPATKYTYTKAGKGATLTVEASLVLSAVADHEPIEPKERAKAEIITKGMLLSETYNLPGSFEAIKGVASEGQTASLEMNQVHMLDGTGPIKDLKGVEKLVFKIAEVKEDASAMKAFKAELESAKKEWEAMKEKAEAAE